MKTHYFTLLLIIIVITACSNEKKQTQIIGKWDLEFADLKSVLDLNSDKTPNAKNRKEVLPDNQIILNADSTYFLVLSKLQNISFGKWSFNNDQIILKPTDPSQDKLIFIIDEIGSDKMKSRLDFAEKPLSDNYLYIYNYFEYRKQDPDFFKSSFSNYGNIDKNRWRIKASQPESEAQIRDRVRGALDFTLSYLKYNQEYISGQKKNSISLKILRNVPLFFASNGIQLEPNDDWAEIFYDDNDLQLSYSIWEKAFQGIKDVYISDEYKGKPLELNLYILEHLRDALN
ncbi:hypothetical protein M2451_001786 [Dysgonomonas sp. PFB1-18]|uniref:hypothetical protein n=1 Tax=unclassified Dysgonomonas TaxID=2630389 RepID=UPI002476611A|nr:MULTISPECIES: hypothetical protein [unclassified Dysgonomonas]MDH6309215.1 hypothetical protein [Dysgonomonas sp. PF1-14]MDH6338905.1 hypothetical protein [Dysgonomonas sp. PF1-16]MDH6380464.1 hypothetical protein [Dysgonomonas sp. PFB1-18]MDH6397733.1 hypothetical protein [Dysgonomonas sp. PF1-23]